MARAKRNATSSPKVNLKRRKRRAARVDRNATEFISDGHQPVVFRHPVAARQRPGFDLPGAGGYRQIGNRRIFGFARAVRNDGAKAGFVRHADGIQRFGQRADLVHFN